MNLPRYVVHHGNGYAFRIIVPSHLRPQVGKSVIKRSLRTRDPRVAQAWALVLAHRYSMAFQRLTRANMTEDAEDLLASALRALEGPGKQYKISRNRHGTFSVETDGTEQDHKQAMDMLALMQRQPAPPTSPTLPDNSDLDALAPRGLKRISLRKAVEEYKARIKPASSERAKVKTFNGPISKVLSEFEDWAGANAYVYNLTRNDVSKFTTRLLGTGLAKSTVRDKLSYLGGFFEFAQSSQYFANGDNPASGHITVTKRDKRESAKRGWKRFSAEQLKTIFHPDNFDQIKDRDTRWLALLALYTGARSNELAQIDLVDCAKIAGLPCITITDEGEDKSVKGEHSVRNVPIHPDLIALGFWDMVEAMQTRGEKQLFPNANRKALNGPAQAMGKKFSAYLASLKISARGEGKVGLRSFRPTVITQMAENGVSQGWRELYVGHEQSEGVSTQETSHAISYTKTQLIEQIAKQCHPSLTWSKAFLDVANLKLLLT